MRWLCTRYCDAEFVPYWWFEKFSRFTMTEQLLVSFLSPPVTAGGGPFLSVIGGYLAVFMLQGATWTQRLTFKPHIGTFFTLSRCPRFMCRHCAGVRRDSGTYRTSNWTDCGLQRVHFSKAVDAVRESSVCMSQSFFHRWWWFSKYAHSQRSTRLYMSRRGYTKH